MPDTDRTTIAGRKGKAVLLVIGCLPFTAIGLWMLAAMTGTIVEMGLDESRLKQAGIALFSILFFGGGFVLGLWMLFDKRPALVLSSAGVHDGSGGTSFGFVPWSDVADIAKFKAGRHETLILMVKEPEKYLRAGGPLARMLRRLNYKTTGSPVSINCMLLKVRFEDFAIMARRYLNTYGGRAMSSSPAPSDPDLRDWAAGSPAVQRRHSLD